MAYGQRPWCTSESEVPPPGRWRRAALLAALVLLPGCQTLNRMDYLDQFFDPKGYEARHQPRLPAVAKPRQPVASPREEQPATIPDQRRPAPAAPEPTVEAASQASTAPDRDQWVRNTVRMHPWLALNWGQLTVAQQQRIEGRLADAGTGRLVASGEPASAWDTMGLDDRADLAFGTAINREGDYATRRR